ncbi:hypothetical protein BLNAU_12258 [Blattamonas nauphoetae]|uniref:Uncharacterized protein n=1 Tax=Blattamonas nauphoetae TaxID=2049346 RepID=A0ABQ9XMS5_9EUKA|nr:hypothetical protein BLNAU_12258 [Blattamonas nauphoetae]
MSNLDDKLKELYNLVQPELETATIIPRRKTLECECNEEEVICISPRKAALNRTYGLLPSDSDSESVSFAVR